MLAVNVVTKSERATWIKTTLHQYHLEWKASTMSCEADTQNTVHIL